MSDADLHKRALLLGVKAGQRKSGWEIPEGFPLMSRTEKVLCLAGLVTEAFFTLGRTGGRQEEIKALSLFWSQNGCPGFLKIGAMALVGGMKTFIDNHLDSMEDGENKAFFSSMRDKTASSGEVPLTEWKKEMGFGFSEVGFFSQEDRDGLILGLSHGELPKSIDEMAYSIVFLSTGGAFDSECARGVAETIKSVSSVEAPGIFSTQWEMPVCDAICSGVMEIFSDAKRRNRHAGKVSRKKPKYPPKPDPAKSLLATADMLNHSEITKISYLAEAATRADMEKIVEISLRKDLGWLCSIVAGMADVVLEKEAENAPSIAAALSEAVLKIAAKGVDPVVEERLSISMALISEHEMTFSCPNDGFSTKTIVSM